VQKTLELIGPKQDDKPVTGSTKEGAEVRPADDAATFTLIG
jgi:hypothetical protein